MGLWDAGHDAYPGDAFTGELARSRELAAAVAYGTLTCFSHLH
eukprot:gene9254-23102_t